MNPLVSFCLKSYNGRRYLREALAGAFAQTYRPLEIVISDDASTDGSWDVIREEVAKHGKTDGVAVIVNRNERNLGNLGNWEKICSPLCIPDRLVRYRLGSGATSEEWNMRRRLAFCLKGNLEVRKCVVPDLEKLRALSEDAYRTWTDRLDREWSQILGKYRLVTGSAWTERLQGLRAMPPTRLVGVSMFLRMAFLMPRVVGSPMLFGYVLFRNVLRRLGVL